MRGKIGNIGDLIGKFWAVAQSGVHRELLFTSGCLSLFPAAKFTLKEAKNTLNTFQILFSHVSNWYKLSQRCCPFVSEKGNSIREVFCEIFCLMHNAAENMGKLEKALS